LPIDVFAADRSMPRRIAIFLLAVYSLSPSIASADLDFWVADGNGATENHLVKYNSTTGITSVPLLDSQNQIYGWPSDLIRVGSTIYGIDTAHRSFYTLNGDSGLVTPIGTFALGSASGLAYDVSNDVMYVSSYSQSNLFTLNRTTGATDLWLHHSALQSIRGIAFNNANGLLYAVSLAGNILSIDPVSKSVQTAVTPVNDVPGSFYDELAFFNGELYAPYVGANYSTAQVRKIDLTTGAVTDIGPLLTDVSAHTVVINSVAAIPEPSMVPALAVLAIVVVLRVKLKHYWDTTRQS
jgi:hypothetical protein